jgi:hypothetical protein
VNEEHPPFALQNALTVAKVIRIDYPKDWPDALPSLINTVRTAPRPAQLYGALLLLLRVIKELSTARLRRHQESLKEVTPELVQLLGGLYTDNVAYWVEFLTQGRGDEDDADYAMQNSLTSFKLLRRLLINGYDQPDQDGLARNVWEVSQTHFGQFLDYVGQDSPVPAPYQDAVGKHLLQFTKLYISMAETRTGSFANLPGTLPLVRSYWSLIANFAQVFEKFGGITHDKGSSSKSKMEGPLLEKLALKGLVLLRSCLAIAFGPKPSTRNLSQEVYQQNLQSMMAVKNELFTNGFVLEIVQVLMTKLFLFRQSDWEAWDADPEEWEAEESQGQAWEWAVRPCSERLFLDLLIHYKDLLKEPLLNYFATAANPNMSVVEKEALYAVMGCAAPSIFQEFDFNDFLKSILLGDLQLQFPFAKLLRRRIAILISQWITVRVDQANKGLVYKIYRDLMDPHHEHNDDVVCFTAARNFRLVVDEFEFDSEAFLPIASDIFNHLIRLLRMASLDDTKHALLETLRAIVGRLDTDVTQFGDALMTVLPELWDETASDVYVTKQPILAIMSTLVNSMKTKSQRYQQSLIPLLRQAMDPTSPLHLHLVEEAVDLWNSILTQSSPPLSEDLIGLVPLAVEPLEFDTPVAYECLKVVKAYILLAPEAMLYDNLRRLVLQGLSKTLDVREPFQAKGGAECIEMMIRAAETLGGAQGVSVVIEDLLAIGLLGKIMQELYQDWEASKQVGPQKPQKLLSNLVEENYFAILARLALASPDLFFQWLTTVGSLAQVWDCLITKWFAHFDAISGVERKKLSCLALTRLCELPEPTQGLVLGKLQDYMAMWISVIEELQTGTEWSSPDIPPDYLVWTEAGGSEYDTVPDVLERQLTFRDPVHSVHTYNFVQQTFQNLVHGVSQQNFQDNWLVNVDKHIVDEFQQLNKRRSSDGD